MTIRLLPLLLLSAYVLFGLAVSIYGPVEYRDYDYSAVTAYIFAFLILFSIGYGFGLAVPSTAVIASREDNAGLVASIFKISLAIAAVLLAVWRMVQLNITSLLLITGLLAFGSCAALRQLHTL